MLINKKPERCKLFWNIIYFYFSTTLFHKQIHLFWHAWRRSMQVIQIKSWLVILIIVWMVISPKLSVTIGWNGSLSLVQFFWMPPTLFQSVKPLKIMKGLHTTHAHTHGSSQDNFLLPQKKISIRRKFDFPKSGW